MLSSTVFSTSRVRSTSTRAAPASAPARSAASRAASARLLGRAQRLLPLFQLSHKEGCCPCHFADFVLAGSCYRYWPSLDLRPHILLKKLQAVDHRALHIGEDRGNCGQAQQ
jgi:hypothetical protein